MVDLSAKQQFLDNEQEAVQFNNIVHSPVFKRAVVLAVSSYVLENCPSSQEVAAIKGYIDTLINLGEKNKPMPTPPDKHLDFTRVGTNPRNEKK